MRSQRTWIVIADGGHVKVFEHSREAPGGLKIVEGLTFSIDLPPTHDLVSEGLSRGYESHGHTRHAKGDKTDPHRELKRAFAKKVADVLTLQLAEKHFDHLVLVAPAATLGDLREALPQGVQARVTGELVHDLVKTPHNELASHLKDFLPNMPGR